jgi:translation elongation factor EF-G
MIHAYVPLAELFGYTSELRNFTSSTASFAMERLRLTTGIGISDMIGISLAQ